MYFILIRECGNQYSTNNTISTSCRYNYSAYLCSSNRECGFKWFAIIRNLDINKNSWRNYNHWNRNQYNHFRTCIRNLYIYCHKCIRMHFHSICKYCS